MEKIRLEPGIAFGIAMVLISLGILLWHLYGRKQYPFIGKEEF